MKLTRRIVRVDTGSPDEEGCLLFANDRLVAVLVQLSFEHNSGLAGKWFVEHAFGSLGATRLRGPRRGGTLGRIAAALTDGSSVLPAK